MTGQKSSRAGRWAASLTGTHKERRRRHGIVQGLVRWHRGQKQEEDIPNVLGKGGGRAAVLTQLGETVRTHDDQADPIADDVARPRIRPRFRNLRALLPQSNGSLMQGRICDVGLRPSSLPHSHLRCSTESEIGPQVCAARSRLSAEGANTGQEGSASASHILPCVVSSLGDPSLPRTHDRSRQHRPSGPRSPSILSRLLL